MKLKTILAAVITAIATAFSENAAACPFQTGTGSTETATITVTDRTGKLPDSLVLDYSTMHWGRRASYSLTSQTALSKNHRYVFKIKFTGPVAYFDIRSLDSLADTKSVYVWPDYFVEKGDDISISISKGTGHKRPDVENLDYFFSGKGAEKLPVLQKLYAAVSELQFRDLVTPEGKYNSKNAENKFLDSFAGRYLPAENKVSAFARQLLIADIGYYILDTQSSLLRSAVRKLDPAARKALLTSYLAFTGQVKAYADTAALVNSQVYSGYQMGIIELDYLSNDMIRSPDSLYFDIKKRFTGLLRDRMIIQLFRTQGYDIQNYNAIIKDATHTVISDTYKRMLEPYLNRMSALPAYDFTLADINGKPVHLHDFKGKLVFIDFWFTGCGHCADYYRDVTKSVEAKFRNDPGIVFITISIDPSRSKWLQGLESGSYTSKSVVNLYTNGMRGAHPVIEHYQVQAYPQPMLIGKDQRIVLFSDARLMNRQGLEYAIREYL
jgi:thiol-disulfide isomerase/thioredoxin